MKIPTNPKYDIDEKGVVRLISSGEIIPEIRNRWNRRSVKIRGKHNKESSQALDRLMLLTYCPPDYDKDSDWLSVRFLDGDPDNISISNLKWDDTWYFPPTLYGTTIPHNTWVPAYGHPSVQIRVMDENVYFRNTYTFREVGTYGSNKYIDIRIPGENRNIQVHRLVALTFLPHPIDTDHLTVNHKDSHSQNNHPDNLEWATYSENNSHSYVEGDRSESIRKITCMNLSTGEEVECIGYAAVGRYLNISSGSVQSVMVNRAYQGMPYKNHLLKYSDDNRSWEELSKFRKPDRKRLSKLAVKNMISGQITHYTSLKQLRRDTGLQPSLVYKLVNSEIMVPWKGLCIQEVVEEKPLKWPNYPEEIIKVYSGSLNSNRPIKVIDKNKEIKYYSGCTEWCMEDRENRCDPAVLSRYMSNNKSNEFRWRDWVFSYIDLSIYTMI